MTGKSETCILYRVWHPELDGRCLGVDDEKGKSLPCDEVIAAGRCPKKLKTPYRKVK